MMFFQKELRRKRLNRRMKDLDYHGRELPEETVLDNLFAIKDRGILSHSDEKVLADFGIRFVFTRTSRVVHKATEDSVISIRFFTPIPDRLLNMSSVFKFHILPLLTRSDLSYLSRTHKYQERLRFIFQSQEIPRIMNQCHKYSHVPIMVRGCKSIYFLEDIKDPKEAYWALLARGVSWRNTIVALMRCIDLYKRWSWKNFLLDLGATQSDINQALHQTTRPLQCQCDNCMQAFFEATRGWLFPPR